jgi:hypothetical protein
LPSNFHSLPSRTEAMPPQRQKHISQKVGMVFTSPPAGGAAAIARDRGSICAAASPPPKLAAEIFRNRLRDNLSVRMLPTFRLWMPCAGNRTAMAQRTNHAHSTPYTPGGI